MTSLLETATAIETPTREEVERLKRDWNRDPCWDLEDTPGFEAHRDELLRHSESMVAHWDAKRIARISAKARALGCSYSLAQYIEHLERGLEQLDDKISALRGW